MENKVQRIYVVFGPSGCGKTTIIKSIVQEQSENYCFTVSPDWVYAVQILRFPILNHHPKTSDTLRGRRNNEEHGREYYFVPRSEFNDMVKQGLFIESTEYAGNLYGTSYHAFKDSLDSGKSPILDIDIEGVKSFQRLHAEKGAPTDHDIRYIYIMTPTIEILEQRLRARGTNSEEDIKRRVQAAIRETEWADAQSTFDFRIINDDFKTSYELFKKALASPNN